MCAVNHINYAAQQTAALAIEERVANWIVQKIVLVIEGHESADVMCGRNVAVTAKSQGAKESARTHQTIKRYRNRP